jgi:hypothetical protein
MSTAVQAEVEITMIRTLSFEISLTSVSNRNQLHLSSSLLKNLFPAIDGA